MEATKQDAMRRIVNELNRAMAGDLEGVDIDYQEPGGLRRLTITVTPVRVRSDLCAKCGEPSETPLCAGCEMAARDKRQEDDTRDITVPKSPPRAPTRYRDRRGG